MGPAPIDCKKAELFYEETTLEHDLINGIPANCGRMASKTHELEKISQWGETFKTGLLTTR
ncbi:hypothetical protein RSAG8_03919, partial [Rhizoctonia solani AG-8 WAC10335]